MTTLIPAQKTSNATAPADRNPRRWIGLAVLCASLLIVTMDMTILNVALPAITADLNPTSVQLLWMVDVYSLVVAGFLVMASGLADRFGRRRMLLVGYAAFGAVPLLVLVADTPAGLIAVRALLGLGGAFIMPSTMSLIRDLFTDAKERAVALGIWGTMAAVGAGIGPIIGGVLVQSFGWHAAFLFNTPVMIIAIVAGIMLLPESKGTAIRWDVPSIVLSIVGMTAVMYAVKTFGKHGVTDATALVSAGLAVVALTWFARRCLNRPDPLLDIRLLRKPALTAGLVSALVSSIAIAAMMLILAQWMQLVEGYTPVETGVHLLPAAIATFILSPLAPRIAEVIGVRTVMAGGLAIGGAGFALLFFAGQPLTYPIVALALVLVGMGMASLAIGSAVIISAVPPKRTGNAAAMEETSFELGNTLGVAVLGSLAAVVFRKVLSIGELKNLGITGDAAESANESVGGALIVADRLGDDGAALAGQAQAAFTDSLAVVGLAGGVLMALAAIAVWFMTPRGLTVDGEH